VRARGTVLVLAVGLALAGCSSSSKSGSSTTTTPTGSAGRPHVTFVAQDYSFTAPATIPAGYVDVSVKNEGKEDHQVQLVKLGSMSLDQFKNAAIKTNIGAVQKSTVFVGGPNVANPGKTTTATVKLAPGKYAVVCFIPANSDGKPHAAHGMITAVDVAQTDASDETTPSPASTIALKDFSFTVPAGFTGQGVVDIANQGTEVHEMGLVKLKPGKTLKDAKGFLLTPPGTPPPAGPPPFVSVPDNGGITGISPQQHAWLDMKLTPGNYVLICFFPDPKKNDIPHALEGMVKEFTIK
jgi:plastocyanin